MLCPEQSAQAGSFFVKLRDGSPEDSANRPLHFSVQVHRAYRLTKRRMRTLITKPSIMKVETVAEPP